MRELIMDWAELILGLACVGLLLLPPKWDPAVKLKEWAERRAKKD